MDAVINILQVVWFMIKWTFITFFSLPFVYITVPLLLLFIIKIAILKVRKRK